MLLCLPWLLILGWHEGAAEAYVLVLWLVWFVVVGGEWGAVGVMCTISFMWLSTLFFASSIRLFMSMVSSLIWESKASLIVWLICVSSSSPKRKVMAQIALIVGFCTPGKADIWWRQMARDWWEAGSPSGQSNERCSKYFLPSNESFISCCSSRMMGGPFLRVFGHVAVLWFVFSWSACVGGLFLFAAEGGIFWGFSLELLEWCCGDGRGFWVLSWVRIYWVLGTFCWVFTALTEPHLCFPLLRVWEKLETEVVRDQQLQ